MIQESLEKNIFIKINNYYLSVFVLRRIDTKYLKDFLHFLIHEEIHSTLFRLLGIKKTKITLHYTLYDNIFHFQGKCKPLGKASFYMLFVIDFVHLIYDIIDDLLHFNMKALSEHFIDYFKDIIYNVKKIKEEQLCQDRK